MKVLFFVFLLSTVFHNSKSSLTTNEEFKDMWKLLDQIAEILDVPEYVPQNSAKLHEDIILENDPIPMDHSHLHSHSHGSSDLENSSSSKCCNSKSCSSSGSKPCQCSKNSPSQEQKIPEHNSQRTFQRLPTSSSSHINKPLNTASTCHACSSSSESHNTAFEQRHVIEKRPVSTQERQIPFNNHPEYSEYPTHGTCNQCSSFQFPNLPVLHPIPPLPLPPPCTYPVPNQWMGHYNYYKPAHY